MKNYDSKINPYLGAGILGITTPVAIYFIGFLAMMMAAVVTTILLPFVWNNFDKLVNVMTIGCLVLQVIAIVVITLIISAFADMKIYHLLMSAAASLILFFIAERFIKNVRFINLPWQAVIFPKLFPNGFKSGFDELRLYLPTTLILTGTFLAISLITWGIYRAALRNKQHGEE